MPCLVMLLTAEGLQPVPYLTDSLADAEKYEPLDGIYTVANTYNTFKVLKLDAHLDRLEDSARRENIPLKLDRLALRNALRQMITESRFGDVRFRITVAREHPDQFILSIEPFKPPAPEVYAAGVSCITLQESTAARHNPAAKTTRWMHDREHFTLPAGIYTGLLLDSNGAVLEGMTSNFYAILSGELRTAGEGVLYGVAQQIVFTVASDILPVNKTAINVADIPSLSEAFLTSSSRGIMPIVEIDGITIGDGKPGAKTTALRAAYIQWVASHLEDL